MSDESNLEITSRQRMEAEHARHQRLMEHTGFLLEKALARAVEHLGKHTQEVKRITRCNGLTKVELGPVATIDQVLALYQAVRKLAVNQAVRKLAVNQAVRKLAVNQENTLKTLEPIIVLVHSARVQVNGLLRV